VSGLASAVEAAGGAGAPDSALAQLREELAAALRRGRAELDKPRSGYRDPVEVGFAAADGMLVAATPARAALRADPQAAGEREWLLVAAVAGALVELAEPGPLVGAADLALRAGDLPGGFLAVGIAATPAELDEYAPLAFEEHASGIDRLRARATAIPGRLLAGVELREPIGEGHPLRIAEAVARLGGRPADPRSVEDHEDAVLALLEPAAGRTVRPHEDPDPALRVARRILQRLDGMGKWGGYHTEFAHLPRGFAGNERALAQDVGEALLAAGLLAEKPSVGQRHVYLNSRKAAEIRRLIDSGELPPGMRLPG
jgi:hypothetical protein